MATIRVLLLTSDIAYCHKIVPYFGKHHSEVKISIVHSASDIAESMKSNIYNVILIGEEFAGLQLNFPSNAVSVYITSNSSGAEINGKPSFCKYRSGEVIYRTILSLYSEVSAFSERDFKVGKVYSFMGANGGAGTTTAAAALAYRLAGMGQKVIFLNLDKFSDDSQLFSDSSEGGNMSDLIFLIANGGSVSNISMKCDSLLKRDGSGVKFMENCVNPCDFDELSYEQMALMFEALSGAGNFDGVIIDGNMYDERVWRLMREKSDMIFLIADNSISASSKLSKVVDFLVTNDRRGAENLTAKTLLIANRGSMISGVDSEDVLFGGAFPKYKDSNARGIAEAISRLEMWNNIINR